MGCFSEECPASAVTGAAEEPGIDRESWEASVTHSLLSQGGLCNWLGPLCVKANEKKPSQQTISAKGNQDQSIRNTSLSNVERYVRAL